MSQPIDSSRGVVTAPQEVVNKKKPTNFWQNAFVGGISSMFAIPAIQPMIYFKNVQQAKATQEAKAAHEVTGFKKNPRVWYRGVGSLPQASLLL